MKRILIIDFEARSLASTRKLFEAEGYDVLTATSGTDASRVLREDPPELVVLEPMIPGQDGFQLCQALKRGEFGRTIPVVVASRIYRGPRYKAMSREAGADAYIERPQQDPQLLATAKKLIGEPAPFVAPSVPDPPPIQEPEIQAFEIPAPLPAPLPPASSAPTVSSAIPRESTPAPLAFASGAPRRAPAPAPAPITESVPLPASKKTAAPAPPKLAIPAPAAVPPAAQTAATGSEPRLALTPAPAAAKAPPARIVDPSFQRMSDNEIEGALDLVFGNSGPVAVTPPAAALEPLTTAPHQIIPPPADYSQDGSEALAQQAVAVFDEILPAQVAAMVPEPASFDFSPDLLEPLPHSPSSSHAFQQEPALGYLPVAGETPPDGVLPGDLASALDRLELRPGTPSRARTLEGPVGFEEDTFRQAPADIPFTGPDGFTAVDFDVLRGEDPETHGFELVTESRLQPEAPFPGVHVPRERSSDRGALPTADQRRAAQPASPPPAPQHPDAHPGGGDFDDELERAFANLTSPIDAGDFSVAPAAGPEAGDTQPSPPNPDPFVPAPESQVPEGLRGKDAGTAELLSSLEELENSLPEDSSVFTGSGWTGSSNHGDSLRDAARELEPSIPLVPPPPDRLEQSLEEIISRVCLPEPAPVSVYGAGREDQAIEPLAALSGGIPSPHRDEGPDPDIPNEGDLFQGEKRSALARLIKNILPLLILALAIGGYFSLRGKTAPQNPSPSENIQELTAENPTPLAASHRRPAPLPSARLKPQFRQIPQTAAASPSPQPPPAFPVPRSEPVPASARNRRSAIPEPASAAGEIDPDHDLATIDELDEPVQAVHSTSPVLTPEAVNAGVTDAKAAISILVGPQGEVLEARVVSDPGNGLGAVAKETMLGWRFSPPRRNQKPVRVWLAETVSFQAP